MKDALIGIGFLALSGACIAAYGVARIWRLERQLRRQGIPVERGIWS